MALGGPCRAGARFGRHQEGAIMQEWQVITTGAAVAVAVASLLVLVGQRKLVQIIHCLAHRIQKK